MPYTAGPVLGAMQSQTDLTQRKSYLEGVRVRRAAEAASAREERKLQVAERKQELEESKANRDYETQQKMIKDRQAALKALPPRPGAEATPEEQSAWFQHAATTLAEKGFDDSAQKFLDIGEQQYGQGVKGPSEMESAEVGRGLTIAQTGTQESLAAKYDAEADYITSGQKSIDANKKTAPKPLTPKQQIDQMDAMTGMITGDMLNSLPDIEREELSGTDGKPSGEFTPTKLNNINTEWYIDTYRDLIEETGTVEAARDHMRQTNKVITSEDTTSWYQDDDSEQYIVPKGFIQMLGDELGHAPTNSEIIARWKLNLAEYQYGSNLEKANRSQ